MNAISRGRAAETAAQSGSCRRRRFTLSRRPVLTAGTDPANGDRLGDVVLKPVRVEGQCNDSKGLTGGGGSVLAGANGDGQFTAQLTGSVPLLPSSVYPCRSYHHLTYQHHCHSGLQPRKRSRAGEALCCSPPAGIWQSSASVFWTGCPGEQNVDATVLLSSSSQRDVGGVNKVCSSMI